MRNSRKSDRPSTQNFEGNSYLDTDLSFFGVLSLFFRAIYIYIIILYI